MLFWVTGMNKDFANEARRERIIQLVQVIDAACRPMSAQKSQNDHLTECLAAAATYAGTCYGTAMSLGAVSGEEEYLARAMQVVLSNFHDGIGVALRRMERVAKEGGSLQ
jgi:hypothetical protein